MRTIKYLAPEPEGLRGKVEFMLRMVPPGRQRMNIKRDGELLVSLTPGDSVEFIVKDASDIEALICKYSGPGTEIEYV